MKSTAVNHAAKSAEQHANVVREQAAKVGDKVGVARKQAQLGAKVVAAYTASFFKTLFAK